jgi:exopolysaccharide biosynthesis protein
MKRKLIGTMMVCAIFLQGLVFADYTTLYERQSEPVEIANGVTQRAIQRFTEGGWLNINIIEVDLTKDASMTVVTDDYLSSRDTLTNLVKESDEASRIVAAINSDFFDTANNTTMGTLIKSGEILSTSVGYDEFASFNISKLGLPFVGYINTPKNTLTNGKTTMNISYINKPYLNYNRTIIYTDKWGKQSFGNTLGMQIVEMLVVDDKVKDMRYNGAPFTIPENGYVIASVGTDISALSNGFSIGDTISLKYDTNFNAIDLAIGGGAQIVSKGVVPTTFSQNITGNNPRTAVGLNKNRNRIYMVTIDGRTNSYRGVTQTELAKIMIELGSYEAINLDGGGSTEMVVKTPWESEVSIVNNPSDGAQRHMYTGLAVLKNVTASPVLKAISINDTSGAILLGQSMALSISALDSNYTLQEVDPSQVTWQFNGVEGSQNGGVFTPQSAGKVTVTATYQGLSASKTFTVYDDAVAIVVEPSQLKLAAGEQKEVLFYIKTEEGAKVKLSPEMLTMLIPESLGTFDVASSQFTASEVEQQGFFSVGFNDLVSYVPVAIGTDKALMFDFENSESEEPAVFLSYPSLVTGRYKTMQFAKSGKAAGMIAYDFTTTTETRAAYMVFSKPIVLPSNTESVGLWAYGNFGNSHWLRGKIVDADGTAVNITFARNIDWSGWRYVSAALPSGLKAPFVLERVYVVETDPLKSDEGTVVIDDIYAVVGQTVNIEVPSNISREKALDAYRISSDTISENATFSVQYINGSTTKALTETLKESTQNIVINTTSPTVTQFKSTVVKGVNVLYLNNQNNSIRKNGASQWTQFIEQVGKINQSSVVVVMNSPAVYADALEQGLLMEQLQILSDKGLDVTLVYPTTGAYQMKKQLGVRILSVPVSNDVLKRITFGGLGKKLEFQIQ